MRGVCVMKSRQPDGHMGNKKAFIYLYDLIKWHLLMSPGGCVLVPGNTCVCALAAVCVCLVFNDK